jgi:hypothetical protein
MTERDLSDLLRALGGMDDYEAEQFLGRLKAELNKPPEQPKQAGASVNQQSLEASYQAELARLMDNQFSGKESRVELRRRYREMGLVRLGGDPAITEQVQARQQVLMAPTPAELEALKDEYDAAIKAALARGARMDEKLRLRDKFRRRGLRDF